MNSKQSAIVSSCRTIIAGTLLEECTPDASNNRASYEGTELVVAEQPALVQRLEPHLQPAHTPRASELEVSEPREGWCQATHAVSCSSSRAGFGAIISSILASSVA